jgi:hypothetical protein
LLVDVSAKVTKPAVSSEALGVYVAFKTDELGEKVPVPPDQIPVVVGPDTIPERTLYALFLQENKSIPAFTEGAVVNTIKTLSFTCEQFPLLVDVKIKFTEPELISLALGEYVAFKSVLFGVNVPVPPDQIPVVLPPDTVPERIDAALFLQALIFTPALTTGDGVNVILTVSFIKKQLLLLVEVKIRFTKPAVNSVVFGLYVAVKTELLGLNDPEPPDQIPVVVPPDTVPERTVIILFLQVVISVPAFTTGDGVKLILTLSTD